VGVFCLLAAAHLFVFAAAFPFFNSTDEQVHFDLVVRYSHGDVPRAFDLLSAEPIPYLAVFHTVEYYFPPGFFPDKQIPPPPWTLPESVAEKGMQERAAQWKGIINYEASQPPLYYSVAGFWWRLGKLLGLQGGALLYWLRFLNMAVIVALVLLAHGAASMLFPENLFIRLAAPALVMFMPQTIFYGINNDIFSPLTFGAAFVLLLKFHARELPGRRLAAATGLALAAVFLTKVSNLPLVAVAVAVLALKFYAQARTHQWRAALPAWGILAAGAALPAAAWMTWSCIHFGDLTGSAGKIRIVGWTDKPVPEWFHHPLFTAHGFWIFVSENLSTFWQGEFRWDGRPMPWPAAGLAYVALTLGLLLVALITLVGRRAGCSAAQRAALWCGFGGLLALFLFAALLSVKYDFDGCLYPSRAHPYFTSGRLMLGMLIPLLLLLAFGLDRALGRLGYAAKFSVLAGLLLAMLATEIATDWPIFSNPYNWFHM